MNTKFTEIETVLNLVKSKIDAHLKFKKKYDKQLAIDFSLFQFFSVGENKTSQLLAYFLDVNQNHGQGAIFLSEFLKFFTDKEINIEQVENVCEKIITKNRRLDIYIKLKELTIGIENKIWADDQNNQLKDYSTFLDKNAQGNYILFYLNPFGDEPKSKSIDETLKQKLYDENKLKIISYKDDIIPLINHWLIHCKADNVSYFLKEFKKYLEVKFLGKNNLNMSKELREIIYKNETEVSQLVQEFKSIEKDIISKLNAIGNKLNKVILEIDDNVKISKFGLFNYQGSRIYKYSIAKNENLIWVEFMQNGINLYSHYYLAGGTDIIFNQILSELNVNRHKKINYQQSESKLIQIFLNQVRLAQEGFRIYDELPG